jgi:hypothetical protein
MRNVLYDDAQGAEVISDTIGDTGRWSVHHTLIFKFEDKFYRSYYSRGATENQDEHPFEHDNEVHCVQVAPFERPVIVYEPI